MVMVVVMVLTKESGLGACDWMNVGRISGSGVATPAEFDRDDEIVENGVEGGDGVGAGDG
jgi:hypothetical protein